MTASTPNKNSHRLAVVAVVDDEEMVTISLKSFLELESEYRVLTFQSPITALNTLQKSPPDIIISDFLMPDMDGLEFLRQFKKLFPNVPRILLTAYADKENAIKGINEIGLFQYVEKPWDNDHLKLTIQNGLMNKCLQEELQNKVHEIDLLLKQRDEVFKVNNLLQRELELAQQVHNRLLPRQTFELNDIKISVQYKPAFEIGGDYYDVIELAENRLAVIIADLTGHGIQAALSTALLKFALFGLSYANVDGIEIMERVNSVLFRGLPADIFAAAMVVIIDTAQSTCQIINGGIPYPYLVNRSNKTIDKILVHGLLIGMVDNNLYHPEEVTTIELRPEDSLILFTDGLTDARNDAGIFMGDNVIEDIVRKHMRKSGREIIAELDRAVQHFRVNIDEIDDTTIIGIDIKTPKSS